MRVLVEVLGCDGKFSDGKALFDVELPFTPAPGDDLILTPGPTWGTIECLVVKRVILSDGVRLVARMSGAT